MSVARDQPDYSRTIRPFWYDRYPSSPVESYIKFNVAPHGLTSRWTYTVPPGRRAFIEILAVKVLRQTVADTVGIARADILIHITGVPTPRILSAFICTNVAGDTDRGEVGHSVILNAGEWIKGETSDSSIGGTCAYLLTLKVTEFDA